MSRRPSGTVTIVRTSSNGGVVYLLPPDGNTAHQLLTIEAAAITFDPQTPASAVDTWMIY